MNVIIAAQEKWEAVQKINQAAKLRVENDRKPTRSLFSGKPLCADCKDPFGASTETQRRKKGAVKRYVSYCCEKYIRLGRSVCFCPKLKNPIRMPPVFKIGRRQ